jgi:hypothetical protein
MVMVCFFIYTLFENLRIGRASSVKKGDEGGGGETKKGNYEVDHETKRTLVAALIIVSV